MTFNEEPPKTFDTYSIISVLAVIVNRLLGRKVRLRSENSSRIWAIIGMAFHSVGYGIFFINMSKKIDSKHAATVLKLVGAANILFCFLNHNAPARRNGNHIELFVFAWFFYITVFILKTKLHLFKFLCIICLMIFYFTLYLYGFGNWGLLAIMQKISFICAMLLVLGLEYFTRRVDFKQIAAGG